jgi:hypothetical protein
MQRQFGLIAALFVFCPWLAACNNDDVVILPSGDADIADSADSSLSALADSGVPDAAPDATASTPDASAPNADSSSMSDAPEGATDANSAADGNGVTPQLLLSYNGSSQSELVVVDVGSRAVSGRLSYPGYIGTTYVGATSPWLLEQAQDIVAALDPLQPWLVRGSWNVSLADAIDGGAPSSDPVAVVIAAGTKAYVLRYTRNEIAVIDTSHGGADGATAMGSIDLSAEVQANGDGFVEMTAGAYDPGRGRVYVLLANINRTLVANDGFTLLCANTRPTVVAIDVATDTLIDLNGAADGVGISLSGYDPAWGQAAMVYDNASDRLLVLHAGCNVSEDGGAIGALQGRGIEEVSLFAATTRTLLDLTDAGYPQSLVYIDANRAIVQLDTAYTWDPTIPTLGSPIANAPTAYDWDGHGNLVGIAPRNGADGGQVGWNVVSVPVAGGEVITLVTDPFSLSGGFVSGAQLWPRP